MNNVTTISLHNNVETTQQTLHELEQSEEFNISVFMSRILVDIIQLNNMITKIYDKYPEFFTFTSKHHLTLIDFSHLTLEHSSTIGKLINDKYITKCYIVYQIVRDENAYRLDKIYKLPEINLCFLECIAYYRMASIWDLHMSPTTDWNQLFSSSSHIPQVTFQVVGKTRDNSNNSERHFMETNIKSLDELTLNDVIVEKNPDQSKIIMYIEFRRKILEQKIEILNQFKQFYKNYKEQNQIQECPI